MHFPTWVDLKGQDSVPDTVHHVIVPVNPRQDSSWTNLKRSIQTDGVHAKDRVGAGIGNKHALKKYDQFSLNTNSRVIFTRFDS